MFATADLLYTAAVLCASIHQHIHECGDFRTSNRCRSAELYLLLAIPYRYKVESKSAATDLEARAILHLQQLGLARVLNLRVGGSAR